uniref:Uncharacterized protein n=1 Tax=Romanomermis culicivorax TaxID=13658 RepID=A0A915JU50_ROMCU
MENIGSKTRVGDGATLDIIRLPWARNRELEYTHPRDFPKNRSPIETDNDDWLIFGGVTVVKMVAIFDSDSLRASVFLSMMPPATG